MELVGGCARVSALAGALMRGAPWPLVPHDKVKRLGRDAASFARRAAME